jgi:hypothetical protein
MSKKVGTTAARLNIHIATAARRSGGIHKAPMRKIVEVSQTSPPPQYAIVRHGSGQGSERVLTTGHAT